MLLTKCYSDELREGRGYVEGKGRELHRLGWRNVNHRDNIGGYRNVLSKEWEGMAWIHLAQEAVSWRAVVDTVMNLLVTKNSGYFLIN